MSKVRALNSILGSLKITTQPGNDSRKQKAPTVKLYKSTSYHTDAEHERAYDRCSDGVPPNRELQGAQSDNLCLTTQTLNTGGLMIAALTALRRTEIYKMYRARSNNFLRTCPPVGSVHYLAAPIANLSTRKWLPEHCVHCRLIHSR